jgi:hypothetical protein
VEDEFLPQGPSPVRDWGFRGLLLAIRIDFSRALLVLFGSGPLPLGSERLLARLSLRALSARAAKLGFLTVATRFNSSRLETLFLSPSPCEKESDQDQDSDDD